MKKNKPYIDKVGCCYYLIVDLKGLSMYERASAINHFIKRDTKILETHIDNEIRALLAEYNIISTLTDKEQIKCALESLKMRYRKEIVINDIYKDFVRNETLTTVGISENHMTIVIEDNRYLQCGIELYIKGDDD